MASSLTRQRTKTFILLAGSMISRARDPSIVIPPVHVAAKFAYEAGNLPRVTSFGVHKTPFREVDKEAIAKTCPEAAASVWRGCQVETYEEFKTTARGGAVAQSTRGGEDRRFLAAEDTLNVLDFEKDYSMAEKDATASGIVDYSLSRES